MRCICPHSLFSGNCPKTCFVKWTTDEKRSEKLLRLTDILIAQAGPFKPDASGWAVGYRSGLIKAARLVESNWNDHG
jgi:hypothetical protein